MPSTLLVLFGNQLFPDHPDLPVFLAEDLQLCRRFRYHRHKLILIMSAMRSFRDELAKKQKVYYYTIEDRRDYIEKLRDAVHRSGAVRLTAYKSADIHLSAMLNNFAHTLGLTVQFLPSPKFLLSDEEARVAVDPVRPRMQTFYISQRKRLGIMLSGSKPEGGKWSFDTENRKPFPPDIHFDTRPLHPQTGRTLEAIHTVDTLFPDNPGSGDTFFLPTTRSQALEWMHYFFLNLYPLFGPYEDAIHSEEVFAYHSLFSPLLNIGLLLPDEIVQAAMEYSAPISSREGFIRQIIGWREFIRAVYLTREFNTNYFNNTNALSDTWYTGSTGIPILDDSIRKVIRFGYVHHIERLMVIGNIMLLCEIHPDEVFRWFSELFVDADDWVMVPNVYGMSQYADGGGFASKPYIAASRYLLKMSTYQRGPWCSVIDGLFWRFVSKHRPAFDENPRTRMLSSWLSKIQPEQLAVHFKRGDTFISNNTR